MNKRNNKTKSSNKTTVAKNNFDLLSNLDDENNIVSQEPVTVATKVIDTPVIESGARISVVEGVDMDKSRKKNKGSDWTVCKRKSTKGKDSVDKRNVYTATESAPDEVEDESHAIKGSDYKLNDTWNVFVHEAESTDWKVETYKKIYAIHDLDTFWKFFSNMDKLDMGKYQFFIMRKTSLPTWEHVSNRDGGICSVRAQRLRAEELIEQLAVLVCNESFSDKPSTINGISFSVKASYGFVKIWNSDGTIDTTKYLPGYIAKKYSATSRFKKNEPEY